MHRIEAKMCGDTQVNPVGFITFSECSEGYIHMVNPCKVLRNFSNLTNDFLMSSAFRLVLQLVSHFAFNYKLVCIFCVRTASSCEEQRVEERRSLPPT